MKTLATSLDWQTVESELNGLANTLPMFKPDINRFIKSIHSKVTELSQKEVELRRTHSKATERICEDLKNQINEQITMVRKFHLMSLLAQ